MTKNTQAAIDAMESTLVDTVKVTTTGSVSIDHYDNAKAEVSEGALFVRYKTEDTYWITIYPSGAWSEAVSSCPKERLVASLDSQVLRAIQAT